MRASARYRRGFSLVELSVAAFLSALLVSLLAEYWSHWQRASAQVAARCQLTREAEIAFAAIADDLRRRQDATAAPPCPDVLSLDYFRYSPSGHPQLDILHDGSPIANYYVDRSAGCLIRNYTYTDQRVVAWDVEDMEVVLLTDADSSANPDVIIGDWHATLVDGAAVRITLTLSLPMVENRALADPDLKREYTLITVVP